jgi:prolyl oligopeptidase
MWLMARRCTGRLIILALMALAGYSSSPNLFEAAAENAVVYPLNKAVDTVDDYHGVRVADPYRWLEDLNSADTKEWIERQDAVTRRYLNSLPMREALRKRITELWNFPKVSVPSREGGRFWYRKNSGLQRQAAVYSRESLEAPPVLVLDPNEFSPDGSIALAQFAPSPDGKYLAYAVSDGGIDWQKIYVRDLQSQRVLDDAVAWVRFSRIAWTHDGNGFFYSRYPASSDGKREAPLGTHSLYYHRLGTAQSADLLVYTQNDQPRGFVRGLVTGDGRYLIIRISQGSARKNRIYFIDFGDPRRPNLGASVKPIIAPPSAKYQFIGNVGSTFYFMTDWNAPKRQVVAVDARTAEAINPKTVIAQGSDVLQNATLAGGKIVAQYLVNVQSRVKLFAPDGKELGTLALPSAGTIRDLSGRYDSAELFYTLTAPLRPSTVFVCTHFCRTSIPFEAVKPPFDFKEYETKELFATSRDGTRVPYFLTARKNLSRNGNNPTVLYGYGGFSTSITPRYRPDVPAWLELGGVFVTANIRGGGAYGEEWHRAGMLEHKQNSFDDFIAVAEDLINRGYTAPAKLAIQGGSNGGLLVAAVMNQRPELFAAALPSGGLMDMLRYDKFTTGPAWVAEYGSSSDAKDFQYLIKYSPLHNLKRRICYPATLVMAADKDDRVVPSHSFKYVAGLQTAQGCKRPVLIRIERGTSHSYRPTDRRIAEIVDGWAFVTALTGAKVTAKAARDRGP